MEQQCTIRRARRADAPAISALVVRVLDAGRTVDDGPAQITREAATFGPEDVARLARFNYMLVAEQEGRIVGTASLGGTALNPARQSLHAFFVAPEAQGTGIGSRLLAALEEEARRMGLRTLPVQSSARGRPFYAARGFTMVAERMEDGEVTYQMVKPLT